MNLKSDFFTAKNQTEKVGPKVTLELTNADILHQKNGYKSLLVSSRLRKYALRQQNLIIMSYNQFCLLSSMPKKTQGAAHWELPSPKLTHGLRFFFFYKVFLISA